MAQEAAQRRDSLLAARRAKTVGEAKDELVGIPARKPLHYGDLPVCMAKTQYSFSSDPKLHGAPTGHMIPVREVRLAAGAGFMVAICGEIVTIPGLPRVSSAEAVGLDDNDLVDGLDWTQTSWIRHWPCATEHRSHY